MRFYIDKDTRSGRTYIAPLGKNPQGSGQGPYLIECQKAYQADGLLKKLNAGLVLGPLDKPEDYEALEELVSSLGRVKVFRYKAPL